MYVHLFVGAIDRPIAMATFVPCNAFHYELEVMLKIQRGELAFVDQDVKRTSGPRFLTLDSFYANVSVHLKHTHTHTHTVS